VEVGKLIIGSLPTCAAKCWDRAGVAGFELSNPDIGIFVLFDPKGLECSVRRPPT
jgi:hypothetical protein